MPAEAREVPHKPFPAFALKPETFDHSPTDDKAAQVYDPKPSAGNRYSPEPSQPSSELP